MSGINDAHTRWSRSARYALAITCFLIALFLRFLILPAESGPAFVTFYPALIISFYLCGIGPGALTAALSAIAGSYFFIPPFWTFTHDFGGNIALAIFLLSASLIGLAINRLQSYAQQFRDAVSALRQSEQRYLGMLEDQTEVICRFKADGTVLYVNDAFCRLFGKSREVLVGQKWHPIAWPEDIPRINEKLSSLSPENPVVTIENRIVTSDGSVLWAQFVNRAFYDAQGCLTEIQGVGRDITERKLAEAALKETLAQANRLSDALDNIPSYIYMKDLNHRYTYANKTTLRLFKCSAEELVGAGDANFFPAATVARLRAVDERVLEHGEITTEEIDVPHDDSERRVYWEVKHPIYDEGGKICGLCGISTDITERKLLEEKLADAAKEIEDLYDHAPCGYHSLGPDGTYLRINATELAWLGYEREEVIGKLKFPEVTTPAGQELFRQAFPNFLRDGHIENLEFDLISKNGTARHVIVSATAIRDDSGNFLMSRSVMYDITELQEIEAKLHRLTLEQHAMLDNELVGIVKLRNRNIVWRNKAMDRIFGYELGELTGRSTRMFYKDDAAYQVLGEAAYPILKAHGVYRAQIEMVRKNGETIWVDLSGVQLPGEDTESLWMLADITPIKKHQEEIERIAFHDILTDLPNRLLLSDRLAQALAQTERSDRLLAVCYLDLDGFKPVNDTYGHAAGDKLLKEIARRMQASVRANDTVCRLGGDEFVLLLTSLENVEEYQAVLQRVIEAINLPVALDETHLAKVTASIGVTLFPFDSHDPDTLLRHADQAMYQAKKLGRNCVHLYGPDIPASNIQG